MDSMNGESYVRKHMDEVVEIARRIDTEAVERMVEALVNLRNRNGRLFFLGVGGSAANASHAVNDFRKLVHIEAYSPTDNVSELTARTNDEGWESVFAEWRNKIWYSYSRSAAVVSRRTSVRISSELCNLPGKSVRG